LQLKARNLPDAVKDEAPNKKLRSEADLGYDMGSRQQLLIDGDYDYPFILVAHKRDVRR